mgnify:CR=1 FL=1
MFYKLKRPTEVDWFDLFQLEHPDRAIDLITQMNGPRYDGQSVMQLVSGLEQLCPNGKINPNVVESALRSGEFILVPYSEAMSPMLRQVINLNTSDDHTNSKASEWQLSSNTFSEHLTSTLHYLVDQTPKPVFVAAAVRQKGKPKSAATTQDKQPKDTYWIELVCEYKSDSKNSNAGASNAVDNLPYVVTFSDGSTKKGRLNNGFSRLTNIPAGQVTVEFGYPQAEQELKQCRKELQQCLDDIITVVEKRGSMLDKQLQKENIGMQGLILTGAFFDGLFGALGDSAEGIEQIANDMVSTARVKLNEWEGIADDVKYETIEYIEKKKDTYLEFIAEVDEKRGSVEDAINKSVKQLKSDLEELASYADNAADNAYAYGEKSINELTDTYNHYAMLFEDTEIGKMLKDFPGRYYDAMPKVEAAQAGGGAGFNVLTAVLTGGALAGVAVVGMVASKVGLFRKSKKIIDKILGLLEKKKVTPPSKITKQHNEQAKGESEKSREKEEVKNKDKKKCKICKNDYNAKCPNANPKIKHPSDTKGTGAELTKGILANSSNNYSKIEDHSWYFQRKQGSKNRRSIEAHHLIVSETMNNPDLKEMCEDFGYNINSHKNGVMLPYYMDLACHLGVPLHRGGHDAGQGDPNLSYPRSVKKKVKALNEVIADGEICKVSDVQKEFKKEMNKISDDIFKKIKNFEWTITSDGFDYDIRESKVGCGNKKNIPDKDGVLCKVRDSNDKGKYSHEFPGTALEIKPKQRSKLKIGD